MRRFAPPWPRLAAVLLSVPLAASAPPPMPAVDAPSATLATSLDRMLRKTVDVTIDGKGPFAFAVDTGAERSVISDRLADRLALPPDRPVELHGMAGVDRVRTATMRRLAIVGGHSVGDVSAPVLPHAALGVDGLLGLDALAGLRVEMDFERSTLTLRPGGPQRAANDEDTLVVTARRRFGQLVLVDAKVGDRRVYAIVDSGAQQTVGNTALRRLLARQGRETPAVKIDLISVTGRSVQADLTLMGEMTLGDFSISGVPIAFVDAHPFKKFGLTGKPAMLIGVDTLRAFRHVSLDFETKKVRFERHPVVDRAWARRDLQRERLLRRD